MLDLVFTYCSACGQWRGHWAGCPKVNCSTCDGEQLVKRAEALPFQTAHGPVVTYDVCPDCRATPPPEPRVLPVLRAVDG